MQEKHEIGTNCFGRKIWKGYTTCSQMEV